jgi:alpha-glucoside transport system substrate-binding protein
MRRLRFVLAGMLVAVLVAATACASGGTGGGTTGEKIGTVTVMGVWGGTEIDAFTDVKAGWEAETSGTVAFAGTRDLSAILRARVAGGNPPDLAILPNPALLKDFATAGNLVALNDILDMTAMQQNYSQTWIDLGSVNNKLYGVFIKAATKSTVWYDPKVFNSAGYQIPTTWDELKALSAKMAAAGGPAPWSIGVESGAASGWPGTDWIQEIYLTESGPDMMDKWVAHEIPWTDPSIKSAWQKFGEIALTKGYVPGGTAAELATYFQDATYLPYETPPKAYMDFLGAFTQGFIAAQFPKLVAGQDYDFYKFVKINNPGTVTGGADVIVMFNDTPGSRSLIKYLSDGKNWASWAKLGGFATPNKALDPSNYPDDVARKAAAQLTDAQTFRFDPDDLMPAELQTAYFKGILDYLQNPGNLDKILSDLESVAKTAYANQ